MVVCTQIHAQQAVDLALRVADEMDVNIGHEVGYSIPLETCCTSETVLRYATKVLFFSQTLDASLLNKKRQQHTAFLLHKREENKRL